MPYATVYRSDGRVKSYAMITAVQARDLASMILDDMAGDMMFMGSGRRNNDTVNLLICCAITGKDPDDYVEDEAHVNRGSVNWLCYQEHKERIEPYLSTWCPEGDEHEGYDFIVDTKAVVRIQQKYLLGKEN